MYLCTDFFGLVVRFLKVDMIIVSALQRCTFLLSFFVVCCYLCQMAYLTHMVVVCSLYKRLSTNLILPPKNGAACMI